MSRLHGYLVTSASEINRMYTLLLGFWISQMSCELTSQVYGVLTEPKSFWNTVVIGCSITGYLMTLVILVTICNNTAAEVYSGLY